MAKSLTLDHWTDQGMTPEEVVYLIRQNSHLSEVVGSAFGYDSEKSRQEDGMGNDRSREIAKYLLTVSLQRYVCCTDGHAEGEHAPNGDRQTLKVEKRARRKAAETAAKAQGK
ncbi:hypothetical protein ABZ153_38150 [Streptomyces sp. NPDC006290]|uniref:hypothetical protein n=1 Tax=Streptomyces sp. NPDC006290 TaxID=3156745 RepID=UPI0033B1A2FF